METIVSLVPILQLFEGLRVPNKSGKHAGRYYLNSGT